jgi:hypothetical protein
MCVLIFSTDLSETFLILRIQRDEVIHHSMYDAEKVKDRKQSLQQ